MKSEKIVKRAQNAGLLWKSGNAVTATEVVDAAYKDTGIPVRELGGRRAFLVNMLLDDSRSMRGFEEPVCNAYNAMISELQEADRNADGVEVLFTAGLLNRGLVQPYCRIADIRPLTEEIYLPDHRTPILTSTQQLLGNMIRKVVELQNGGIPVQTYTGILSDGQPTDETWEGYTNIQSVVSDLTKTKQHVLCGITLGNISRNMFLRFGIADKWVIDPAKEKFAFEEAIAMVSRSISSASKSAAAFKKIAEAGVNHGHGVFSDT